MSKREYLPEELFNYYESKLNASRNRALTLLSDQSYLSSEKPQRVKELKDFVQTVETVLRNRVNLGQGVRTLAELSLRADTLGLGKE